MHRHVDQPPSESLAKIGTTLRAEFKEMLKGEEFKGMMKEGIKDVIEENMKDVVHETVLIHYLETDMHRG